MQTTVENIQPFGGSNVFKYKLPLLLQTVRAGFPSPAEDFLDTKLDLNDYLITHPSATFFLRVKGDAMEKAGIFSGSVLIVDRSLKPAKNSVVVAVLNGELLVRRYKKEGDTVWLFADHDSYVPMCITHEMQFEVWGVVTGVISTFT